MRAVACVVICLMLLALLLGCESSSHARIDPAKSSVTTDSRSRPSSNRTVEHTTVRVNLPDAPVKSK